MRIFWRGCYLSASWYPPPRPANNSTISRVSEFIYPSAQWQCAGKHATHGLKHVVGSSTIPMRVSYIVYTQKNSSYANFQSWSAMTQIISHSYHRCGASEHRFPGTHANICASIIHHPLLFWTFFSLLLRFYPSLHYALPSWKWSNC